MLTVLSIFRPLSIFLTEFSISDECCSSDSENKSLISESFRSIIARFLILRVLSDSRNCLTEAKRFPPFIWRSFPKRPSIQSDWNLPRRTYCWCLWFIRYSDNEASPSVVCWRAFQVSTVKPSWEVSFHSWSQSTKPRRSQVLSIKFSDVITSWSLSLFRNAENLLLTFTVFHQLDTIIRNSAVSRKSGWPRRP